MTDRRAAVRRRRKAAERAMSLFFFLCGMAAIAFVLGISLYLIISGLPAIREIGLRKFLTGPVWSPKQERFGILPFLLTSVAGTAGAVLLGVPVGLLASMFLAKAAPPRLAAVIRTQLCTALWV